MVRTMTATPDEHVTTHRPILSGLPDPFRAPLRVVATPVIPSTPTPTEVPMPPETSQSPLILPPTDLPLDREQSPHTGWTRAHYEAAADRLLLALRPYASPKRARFDLPGPASRSRFLSDGMEGFARSFLLAAFRLRGAGGDDPHGFAQWYADGLIAGTDPDSGETWPDFAVFGQAKVEAASIAIGLHETRPWIWDRLEPAAQRRVLDWLAGMINTVTPFNNWTWFRGIANAVSRSLGGEWDPADIQTAIDLTDGWYAGDGWYSDGAPGPDTFLNFDYYNHWAMHYYPLWLGRVLGEDDYGPFMDRSRERLSRFLADAQHMVAADGAPLFQGRSLTYRFAMTMPFWLGALNGCTPLAPGLTRRIASGAVRHFFDHGAAEESGLLSIGWHRRFEAMRQPYTGPGSPYWASKAFAGLLLPADHPVWTAREDPLPLEQADTLTVIRPAGWILSGTRADGIVRLISHGASHNAPHLPVPPQPAPDLPEYAKLGYATHAAPDYAPDWATHSHGGQFALVGPDGIPSRRTPWQTLEIRDRVAISRHRAQWPMGEEVRMGPWMTLATVVHGAWEVRLARVEAGGETLEPGGDRPRATGPFTLRADGWTIVPGTLAGGLPIRAELHDAGGLPVRGRIERTGQNPVGAPDGTSVPEWRATDGPVEVGRIHAVTVVLTAADPGPAPAVAIDGDTVTVTWPDGPSETVTLPPFDGTTGLWAVSGTAG